MLDYRLKLGTYFGIGVYVHWTFALLIGYVAFSVSSGGPLIVAFNVLFLLHVFLCVTLHEYGHALTARRFGIPTLDITLLPIGGVARLRNMPRIAWQELLVAVAGPAVNIVIASILLSVLAVVRPVALSLFSFGDVDAATETQIDQLLTEPSLIGFLVMLAGVNIALVLFNMIPAFPMDGGRVLRSILAMFLEYRRATRIAAIVGVVCAVGLAATAIHYGHVVGLLIAVFVVYAGLSEARQVDIMESVRGLIVADVMIRDTPAVLIDTPLSELLLRWQQEFAPALPVVGLDGFAISILPLSEIVKALQSGADLGTSAGQLAADLSLPGNPIVHGDDKLSDVLMSAGRGRRHFAVADFEGKLIGMLDLDSARIRSQLAPFRPQPMDPV